MNHIVDACPLTKFEGGLNVLHEVDDDAVAWLESTATAALAKWNVGGDTSRRTLNSNSINESINQSINQPTNQSIATSTNSGWMVVQWMPSRWNSALHWSAMRSYSLRLRQRMWAVAMMQLPDSCHTWNSCTLHTPSTCTHTEHVTHQAA